MNGIGTRFKVLTVRGIPLYVAASWLFIAALFIFANYSQLSPATDPWTAIAFSTAEFVLLFGSVLIHEVSHAVVARGFDVPVSGITLTFWGGATETPADARGPLAEFLISAAGPFSTLVVAGICFAAGQAIDPGRTQRLLVSLAEINLLLALLNVLPGYPLDGGRMLEATAWAVSKRRTTGLRVAGWGGVVVGIGMLAYAFIGFTERGLSGWSIWLAFIGFILLGTGRSMPQRIAARERLTGGLVRDAMRPPGATIDAGVSLSEALDLALRDDPDRTFPVSDQGRIVGTVSMATARRVGSRDPMRPVRDAMRPLTASTVLRPEDPLEDAVGWLFSREAFVVRDGALVGTLGADDVEAWYRRRYEPASALPPRPDR